jgi:hypothetical protein
MSVRWLCRYVTARWPAKLKSFLLAKIISLQPGFEKKEFLPIQSRLCKNNLCSPASRRRNFSRSGPGSEKIISLQPGFEKKEFLPIQSRL